MVWLWTASQTYRAADLNHISEVFGRFRRRCAESGEVAARLLSEESRFEQEVVTNGGLAVIPARPKLGETFDMDQIDGVLSKAGIVKPDFSVTAQVTPVKELWLIMTNSGKALVASAAHSGRRLPATSLRRSLP